MPEVYKPKDKPCIQADGADTQALKDQIAKCPSGALSYLMNDSEDQEELSLETKVEALKDGPLLVYGTLNIKNSDGVEEKKEKTTAFCRCGASANKPYCDGSHVKTEFKG